MKQIPNKIFVVMNGKIARPGDEPTKIYHFANLAVFGGRHHGHKMSAHNEFVSASAIQYVVNCSCGDQGAFLYDHNVGGIISYFVKPKRFHLEFLPKRIMTVDELRDYSGHMAMIKVGDTLTENKKEYKWFRNKWFILGGAHGFHLLTHEHYRLEDGCLTNLFYCSCGVVGIHADSLNCDRHRNTRGNELKAYYFIDVLTHAKKIEGPDVNS